jgi:pyridinium-3,5-bisthiocarboxylic acid mononucleotide nickel chelatase
MKTLFYDCFTGISGDMNLGALIDIGIPSEYLLSELKKLKIDGYQIEITRTLKNGISGTRVNVNLEHHKHHGHHEHHPHRNLSDISEIINNSDLSNQIKAISIDIFDKVARAEAKVHNKPIDKVHFHEVGATDSIVDIVGAAICIDYLKPDRILCTPVQLGGGFVECAHGTFPVPAPATAEILQNIPVKKGLVDTETTTPTGAAILATLVDEFVSETELRIVKTGYGIGFKDLKVPNVLRVFICDNEESNDLKHEKACIIECNLDDNNPEIFAFIIDKLFEKGAQDVYLTPIIMKKSRPAVTLSILCPPDKTNEMEKIILTETTTLGIRKHWVEKSMLPRKTKTVATKYGDIRVKYSTFGSLIKHKPEYEDCIKAANENNVTLAEVYKEVERITDKQ